MLGRLGELLTDALEQAGLAPERKAYGIATAFAARVGEAGPLVAVLCEYDALPGIGHACGHNVIAAAGLRAGIAAATVAAEAGGRLLVLGTPSEENLPVGKFMLAEAGAFDGVDAAMMVHGTFHEVPERANIVPALAGDVDVGVLSRAAGSQGTGLDGDQAGTVPYFE